MSDFTIRKQQIIDAATGPEARPRAIDYTPDEHEVWRIISDALAPMWSEHAIPEILRARDTLNLPTAQIPQLSELDSKLANGSAFNFRAVGGLVARDIFFGALANGIFLSTQYIRSGEQPFYTEEPDIVHEVIGHGTLLANTDLAQLHKLAGQAMNRVETEEAKAFIANIWWFSGEFGVIERDETKAFGAGLLSSVDELKHLPHAITHDLDIGVMGTQPYSIDQLQPHLFAAQSLAHVMDVIGGFFEQVDDDSVCKLLKERP